MSIPHIRYMQRCLELARQGNGYTAPNPMVGCVIVYNDFIIGEGFHAIFGDPHAEVEAIKSVAAENRHLLGLTTLYVNLEPCSYFGKTPPCSDLIIETGIPKVVVAGLDPNPKVSGEGIKHLKDAGIDVTQGILEAEAFELNKRFYTFHQKKRPYIVLKWAQSADGYIGKAGRRVTISNALSHRLAHKWRSEEQAIFVGYQTAISDDPQLNTRMWSGQNPVRITLDGDLSLSENLKLFRSDGKLIIFSYKAHPDQANILYRQMDDSKDIIPQILHTLYAENIISVLVEGGAKTLQSFIDSGLWDEGKVITSPKLLGKGVKAPILHNLQASLPEDILDDSLKIYLNPS